jgi:hypothetical protein
VAPAAEVLGVARCGIYIAAVMSEGSSAWATVNVNTLDAVAHFARADAVHVRR